MSTNELDQSKTTKEKEPLPEVQVNGSPEDNEKSEIDSPSQRSRRSKWPWIVGLIVCVIVAVVGIPWVKESLNTVSTDDAYVNGHVTFVAPRVSGQVNSVFVDDNNMVHKGDRLVELDPEPFQVQVNIAEAGLAAARAELTAAKASVRGSEGLARSLRFGLQRAIEDVNDKIATLKLRYAGLEAKKATLNKARADYDRGKPLLTAKAISQQEMDAYTESWLVAQAEVQQALQAVYQTRVSLGLPGIPANGGELTAVPADLNETFSSVREAQAKLMQAAATFGVVASFNKSPTEMLAEFYKRDPQGDIDKIFEELLKVAPTVKQAEAKILQAERNLDEAKLNLRFCKVVAEIDGVVTRRNVNPGNNVVAGQSLMAVRSITEIWIDANFKETQLASLRIGQPVTVEADMYGKHQQFSGRISGFTFGTGSTLAILPAQNATGNFVKVVQRLPVRIELTDYDSQRLPLFIGLSVTPRVHINETPTGASAGEFLQQPTPTTGKGSNKETRS